MSLGAREPKVRKTHRISYARVVDGALAYAREGIRLLTRGCAGLSLVPY